MSRKVASKLFYLGSTSLLSPIISMTGVQASSLLPSSVTANIYAVFFNPGVMLQSPDGVYYADLLGNGSVIVSQGTDPTTSGVNTVYTSPPGPAAGQTPEFPADLGAGQFEVLTSNFGVITELGTFPGYNYITTMSLTDNGALTVSTGGNQDFSDNVNDPVVGYKVSGITYDLANPTITTSQQVTGLVDTETNGTSVTQSFPATLSLSHTDSYSHTFSFSEAFTIGLKTTFEAAIPLIGGDKSELTLSSTTTAGFANTTTTSDTKTFTAGVNVTVPAHSEYEAVITATKETYSVPFTYTGDATYQNGAVVPIDGSGTFDGTDTGVFQTAIICISQPGGCGSGLTGDLGDLPPGFLTRGESLVGIFPATPIPEPSTWAMMLMGFAGLGYAGYRQTRKGQVAIA
jgi:hypothetical protein